MESLSRLRTAGPKAFAMVDGRVVGWFEALDDWGENVALTRSRHLIDGSLSLDGFRVGWMAATPVLSQNPTVHAGDHKHPHYAKSSSKALASFKSSVSKPSVNQP